MGFTGGGSLNGGACGARLGVRIARWLVAVVVAAVVVALSSMAADAHAAGVPAPLTGFLATPTEQLGVPGNVASGEITPEGDIYTGWAEYQLFAGTQLRAWSQPTRVAADPSEPLYEDQLVRGSVRYTEQVFTVAVGDEPVVYLTLTATNLSQRPRTASAALQLEYTRGQPIPTFDGVPASPYRFPRPASDGLGRLQELGESFAPDWTYEIAGRDVVRSGELLVRGPAARARPLPTSGDSLTSAHAKQAYRVTLGGWGRTSWTWQIPLTPPAAGAGADAALDAEPLGVAESDFAAFWREQEAGAMSIELPEQRIDDVYRESLTNILVSRYLSPDGWVQAVNKLQYQAFWLRDSSIMTVALDQANLHRPAGQDLGFLPVWQQPDGLYISQFGQYDGIGQALWEMDEHALLSDDPGYASSVIGSVQAAVQWIAGESADDAYGILPPSTIYDGEQLGDARITGNEIWAAVGLRSAISVASLAGRADLVAAWQAIDQRFETNLDAALAADEAANGHITPALDVPGGADWGNYELAYPMAIVAPNSVEVTNIIAWERAHSDQGLAGYTCPACLHDYMGFPIFESELSRGGASVAEALSGLYAETVHTTSTGGGWEDGPVGTHPRVTVDNLAPHGTFAGQYISLLHNLLVDDQGTQVTLLAGVSPAWLAPGDEIRVTRAATSAGPVSLRLSVTATGASLTWSLRRFAGTSEPLVWALPYWVPRATSRGGRRVDGSVRLPGDAGTMTLRWTARRPAQSLTRAIAALNRDYTHVGEPAPLRPADDW